MIQTVLFFTMCLMVGEGDDRESDCSYQWFLIEDREIFNLFFNAYAIDNDTPADSILGFTVSNHKLVYVRDTDNDYAVLKHEAEHARCNLNYVDKEDTRFVCNWVIDRPQLTRGSIYPDYGWVTDRTLPEYSAKMAESLNLSPPFVTQEYYDGQKELNFRK